MWPHCHFCNIDNTVESSPSNASLPSSDDGRSWSIHCQFFSEAKHLSVLQPYPSPAPVSSGGSTTLSLPPGRVRQLLCSAQLLCCLWQIQWYGVLLISCSPAAAATYSSLASSTTLTLTVLMMPRGYASRSMSSPSNSISTHQFIE